MCFLLWFSDPKHEPRSTMCFLLWFSDHKPKLFSFSGLPRKTIPINKLKFQSAVPINKLFPPLIFRPQTQTKFQSTKTIPINLFLGCRENKSTNSNQLKFQSIKTIPINLFLGCEKTNQRELKLKKTKACKIWKFFSHT